MATVSIVPALLDAMRAAFAAALPSSTNVVDGPDPDSDDGDDVLYVGMADPRQSENTAAHFGQTWPSATAQTRDEDGSIACAAVAWDGSGNVKAARDRAFATVATVQQVLWADTRLGLDGMVKTSFTSINFDQRMTDRGALAVVLFAVDFKALLQRSAS